MDFSFSLARIEFMPNVRRRPLSGKSYASKESGELLEMTSIITQEIKCHLLRDG